jgi:hypothetical protein
VNLSASGASSRGGTTTHAASSVPGPSGSGGSANASVSHRLSGTPVACGYAAAICNSANGQKLSSSICTGQSAGSASTSSVRASPSVPGTAAADIPSETSVRDPPSAAATITSVRTGPGTTCAMTPSTAPIVRSTCSISALPGPSSLTWRSSVKEGKLTGRWSERNSQRRRGPHEPQLRAGAQVDERDPGLALA